jgi:tRNA threonylcarbamoyladenosine biosynthesis protein TsaB
MLLLAADTSGSHGSIALARCESDGTFEILGLDRLEGGTFSAQLIPQIAALLKAHSCSKNEIGAYAVGSGPGSFTGLRVGLAGIKALAEVSGKPIAAVSVLHAVASLSSSSGRIVAAIDAGRRQLYIADYENRQPVSPERVVMLEEFAPEGKVITPDSGVAEYLQKKDFQVELIERPQSDVIARLGWKQIVSGKTISSEALDANYVRRTDAEILIKP